MNKLLVITETDIVMDAESKQAIIIDNGTLNCRAGLSGNDSPSV